MNSRISRLIPLSLTVLVLVLDQLSKALVVARVPFGTIAFSALKDLVWIIQARNPAIAFSMGAGLDPALGKAVFLVLPLVLVAILGAWYFVAKDMGRLQLWSLCGIIGGGLGNLIDRLFRTGGVVDFVSIRFFGIFGLERWPTFNIADASVTICCILLVVALLAEEKRKKA